MGEVKKPKDLYKTSLDGKYKTEKHASLEFLNIAKELKTNNQLYSRKNPTFSSRKSVKKSNSHCKKFGQTENDHIHITDLPSSEKEFKLTSNLKHTLRKIQKKYVSKVSKLLDASPIRITPMPIAAFSEGCSKNGYKKTSSFSSLNKRHPGNGKSFKS